MFCGKCGTKINDGDSFCTNCGAKVVGIINQSNDDFINAVFSIVEEKGTISKGEFTPYFSYSVRPVMWVKI